MDLFSNFRVQYFLGLTGLAIVLLLMRRHRTAITFLVFACLNLLFVIPIYFGGTDAPEGEPTLRAMLINVNTRAGDPARVTAVIKKADPDILVLEEISFRWVEELAWLTNSYPYSLTQPREDNFGIGLYSKLHMTESKIEHIGSVGAPSGASVPPK
jgi:endonuclease/exonuclease/phosphatase (EEP) superfamily protein YafD